MNWHKISIRPKNEVIQHYSQQTQFAKKQYDDKRNEFNNAINRVRKHIVSTMNDRILQYKITYLNCNNPPIITMENIEIDTYITKLSLDSVYLDFVDLNIKRDREYPLEYLHIYEYICAPIREKFRQAGYNVGKSYYTPLRISWA